MNEENLFIAGVKDYALLLDYGSEHINVFKGDTYTFDLQTSQTVPGIAAFVKKAKALRLGWAKLQNDGDEVIYLYDKDDGYFGYAVNLDNPHCSEWGYAPFQ